MRFLAEDLHLRFFVLLVTLGDNDIHVLDKPTPYFFQLGIVVHGSYEGKLFWRGDDRGVGSRSAVPPAILSLLIYLKAVNVVFYCGHTVAPPNQFRYKLLD